MSDRHTLTVVALDAEYIDITPLSGPPAVVVGGLVSVELTNGAVTVHRRMLVSKCPRIGDTFDIELEPEEDDHSPPPLIEFDPEWFYGEPKPSRLSRLFKRKEAE